MTVILSIRKTIRVVLQMYVLVSNYASKIDDDGDDEIKTMLNQIKTVILNSLKSSKGHLSVAKFASVSFCMV